MFKKNESGVFNMSRRILNFRFFASLICLVLLFYCVSFFISSNILAAEQNLKLQILAINDLHGALESRTLNNKPIGGAAVLAGYLDKWENEAAAQGIHTFRVHAGDVIGASPPISALLQDEPTMNILGVAGFVYGCPGNHEFDEGREELLRLQNGGAHPKTEPYTGVWPGAATQYLCASVVDKQTQQPIFPPCAVSEVEGVKVGFIGADLEETPTIVKPSGVATLDFLDEAQSINKYVNELKEQGVETIIVLLHQGGAGDRQGGPISGEIVDIVNAIDDEVDVVITGHTHTGFWGNIGSKIVTQAYSNGTAFADIDLTVDRTTKDVVEKSAQIIDTYHDAAIPADAAVEELVNYYKELAAPISNQVIGTAAYDLTKDQNNAGESALGNLIADAQKWKMGSELAFMNPGGIRANLKSGEVTWGELYTVQPFNNTLVKMNLTGAQIETLMEQQWKDQPYPRVLQISGLNYTWDPAQPAGERVDPAKILVNGQPIETEKTYSVTVNSFLADGGDNFTVLKEGTERENGPVDLDALVEHVQQLDQPFGSSIEGRISIPPDIFVQVTDLHISNFTDAEKTFQAKYDPLAYAPIFVEEMKALRPSFIVATGDLVAKAETKSLAKGLEWFDLYLNNIVNPVTSEGITFYQVPGNHDAGGIKYYKKLEDIPEDLKEYYGDGLFTKKTGFPTFYSFDQGDYHYIVLDPLELDRTVKLPEEQLNWLKNDLEANKEKNIILFFHQPSSNWEDWAEVSDILDGYKIKMMLAGHWHTDEAVDNGFPEQATSSFSGCWWRETVGKDGTPTGYRLVYPLAGEVRHFYKELGANQQINITSPVDIAIDGDTSLNVQAYDALQPVKKLFYRIDGSAWQPMYMEKVGVWYDGKAALNITPDNNYHKIEVGYEAADGTVFSKAQWYKFADDNTITIQEIYDHFDKFHGRYATVRATVTAAFVDGQMPVLQDETAGITVWAGECAGRPAFYDGQGLILRGKVATDGNGLQQMHLNDAENVRITGTPWLPSPKVLEIQAVGSYFYQLVKVENVKVTEASEYEFYVQDGLGQKLLIYTGDVRPAYNPLDNLKIGDIINVSGIAWSYLGEAEICPRFPEDIVTVTQAGEPAQETATIDWLGVYDDQQKAYQGPLMAGKSYYLVCKPKKNTAGSASALTILEVLNNSQPQFLNAARLSVTENQSEFAALYQPAASGNFTLKCFLWNEWSNSVTWSSLAEPKEIDITVSP
jgi:5'-nucleotidase